MLRKNYWKEKQKIYVDVFEAAFGNFQKRTQHKKEWYSTEDDISRDLSFSVEDIIFSTAYKNKQLGLPSFQVYGQPDRKDAKKVKREDKCPDFVWTYVDYSNKLRRDFVIECKRLRNDLTAHSREYVLNGIMRFIEKEWSYGYNCDTGLMIGYVEGVTIENCLNKIADYVTAKKIPPLVNLPHSNATISKNSHSLIRVGIPESPFQLYHFLVVVGKV